MTSDAERQRISRERKKLAEQDAGMPWLGLIGEEREQAIRDFYGYAASETSTQAERQARADRITDSEEAKDVLSQAEAIWAAQASEHSDSRDAKAELEKLRLIAGGQSK